MRFHASRLAVGLLIGAVVTACSGGSTPAPAASQAAAPSAAPVSAAPSPAMSPLPSASLPPATASATFAGGLTGVAPGVLVSCDSPTLGGQVITLFGPTTTKDIYTTISLSAASVSVTIDSGAGVTFVARTFTGTWVTGFDAAKGAQIDSQLAEIVSSSKPGSLPAITSIKGSVDCGNQLPGSSTLTLAGSTPDGAPSGPIDPIRVDCNPNAKPASVHAVGIVGLGSVRDIIVFQATATGFTAFLPPTASTKQHFFMTSDPSAATISPTGAHVSGSATETGTSSTIQVSGDLVCGVVNP